MAYYNPTQYGTYFNNMGNSYPVNYPQAYPQQQAQNNNGVIWVQGEAAAKSYLVAAGTSVLLMDSEAPIFYIKSTDTAGMPMPLRIFQYSEIAQASTPTQAALNSAEYNELKKRCDDLEAMLINAKGTNNETSKGEELYA